MFIEYNANPHNDNIDDCVIRAISKALNKDYWDVFDKLCDVADTYFNSDEINTMKVFHKYLDMLGYECREMTTKMTVKQFSEQFYKGTYLLLVNGHMTVCVNGNIYDTWNSSKYKVQFIWVVKL